jgi:hypothetical protein
MPKSNKLIPLLLVLSLLTLALPHPTPTLAADCGQTSVGFVPLNELGASTYQGFPGGLYPNGSNQMPTAHAQAGLALAQAVQPLNQMGQVDEGNGRIVLLSLGMSNTAQEFTAYMSLAQSDPLLAPDVTIVNGAQSGKSAELASDPDDEFWTVIEQRLASSGLTPQQVQVIWLKEARASVAPGEVFPTDAQILQDQLRSIVQIAKTRYPNLKIAYLSSRIYAGYADTALSPEPEAYQSGFAVKWLIEEQIDGAPALNFDPSQGSVLAPWLAWGPYLWADGLEARSDGLTWLCSDFKADGTHPSEDGAFKVATLLQDFLQTEATAVPWYVSLDTLTFHHFLPLVNR